MCAGITVPGNRAELSGALSGCSSLAGFWSDPKQLGFGGDGGLRVGGIWLLKE